VRPESLEELAQTVRQTREPVRFGLGLLAGIEGEIVHLDALPKLIHYSPADQVVRVGAHSTVEEVQTLLSDRAQCLPYGGNTDETIGRCIALNHPHALEAQCGSWRDWVLGVTVVLADGAMAKSGSMAVKNVAGYDVHKFLVGTRDTLCILVDVTLRTYPAKALPSPQTVLGRRSGIEPKYIHRVQPTDWAAALEAAEDTLVRGDPASCTLWHASMPRRTEHDWMLPLDGPIPVGAAQLEHMRRAKALFDPTDRLNKGLFERSFSA
jgi:FAD/FMN-containing dehydrogenase